MIKITTEQFNFLALSAVKYSCGRCTYMPSSITHTIIQYQRSLDETTKTAILEFLKQKFESGSSLGMSCDVETWTYFYNYIEECAPTLDHMVYVVFTDEVDFYLLYAASLRYNLLDKRVSLLTYLDILKNTELGYAQYFTLYRDLNDEWYLHEDIENREGYKELKEYVHSRLEETNAEYDKIVL